jgi:hypothetical protein
MVKGTYTGMSGSYKVVERMASGPSALLWSAIDQNGSSVCLKSFEYAEPKQNWQHYIKEITARRILSHPNILPILDY